ncbi:MAG: hypothetical protein IJI24_06960 [Lachnospiraceae bacterium]|nr:hypothetical protein [Lachnospiraceae bacterium]
MTDEELLAMTKSNLSLISTTWDTYLGNLINVAKQSIAREGITLNGSLEDDNLIVMYASYLYRKRAEDNPGMPRMLRYALNNRLLSEKAGAE